MATSLLKFSLKTNLVKSVISEIISNISRYYYVYCHPGQWTNESIVEEVSDSFSYENETRNEALLYKQIDSNDICAVVPRYDYVSGRTFDMYDVYTSSSPAYSGATALENAEFYCLTDDFNVYKCLFNNNNKPSSIRPTGTSVNPIRLDDGYIWKYMYTIPLSVRNKFLTATQMPVANSLSNQFYSKGSIVSYTIENPGKKYPRTSYKIIGFSIIDAGANYTSAPTITISNPDLPNGVPATISAVNLTNTGNISSVVINNQGSGYSYPPIITVTGGGTSSGLRQAILEPIVERLGDVYTTLSVTGDGYLEENPYVVDSIQAITKGTGYSSLTFLFTNPDLNNGVKAVATGVIADVTVGTATAHSLNTVSSIVGTKLTGTYTSSISANDFVKIGTATQIYKVLAVHETNSQGIPLAITVDAAVTPAVPTAVKLAGQVTGATITQKGYGYSKQFFSSFQNSAASNIVLVEFQSIGGTTPSGAAVTAAGFTFNVTTKKNEAELSPLINANGEIEAIQITKPGIGYTYALVDVNTSLDPEDEPLFVEASILLNFGIGDIESKQSTVELTAVEGAIHVIRVVSPGFGYTSPPTITITGDGVGCTATAILSSIGSIDRITVNNIGSGYTKATVTITGSSASPAVARAIISPKGGHGKDAIGELYAKTIVFHGNLSKEKNQGFISTNDYRQVCIIKNPKIFQQQNNLRLALASTCFVAIGSKGQAGFNLFALDDELTWTDNTVTPSKSYKFRVIEKIVNYSSTESALLLSYLDNRIPSAGVSFSKTGASFSTTSLIYPDVNKFSGDLLTIDNRLKFSPSEQQIVAVTNSITF